MAPPETLLSAIAEEAMKLLDVDNAGFRLVDGDDLVVAGLAGTASQTMLRPRMPGWPGPLRPKLVPTPPGPQTHRAHEHFSGIPTACVNPALLRPRQIAFERG